jgi:hypothetical protein
MATRAKRGGKGRRGARAFVIVGVVCAAAAGAVAAWLLLKPDPALTRPQLIDANGCYLGIASYTTRSEATRSVIRTGPELERFFRSMAERSIETQDGIATDPPRLACVEECWLWSKNERVGERERLLEDLRRCLSLKASAQQLDTEQVQAAARYVQTQHVKGGGNDLDQDILIRGVDPGSRAGVRQSADVEGPDNKTRQTIRIENEGPARGQELRRDVD